MCYLKETLFSWCNFTFDNIRPLWECTFHFFGVDEKTLDPIFLEFNEISTKKTIEIEAQITLEALSQKQNRRGLISSQFDRSVEPRTRLWLKSKWQPSKNIHRGLNTVGAQLKIRHRLCYRSSSVTSATFRSIPSSS